MQELENQIEIATHNEARAYKSLEKLAKQFNKLKVEKEFFESLVNILSSLISRQSQIIYNISFGCSNFDFV